MADTLFAPPPDQPDNHATRLSGLWLHAFRLCAVVLGVFVMWAAGPGIPEQHTQLVVYTLLTWILTLILCPERKGVAWRAPQAVDWIVGLFFAVCLGFAILRADLVVKAGPGGLDWALWVVAALTAAVAVMRPGARLLALIAVSVFVFGYYEIKFDELILRPGAWTETDFWVGTITVLLAIEVARRGLGLWIPLFGVIALLYAHYGYLLPGALWQRGSSIEQIFDYLMYSQEGIFGVMTSVMATYVLIFIYLGAFMEYSGMGRFFIELPLALAGRSAGGPAKVAVLASSIFGSISGSTLANIVSTGAFTIPLMKRVGFRPHIAGAIENSSSLGGQLLPPVMGSGAFVMSEITGVPYVKIMAISIIPALLYMLSIGFMVHFEAKRSGIRGMDAAEIEPARSVLRRSWFHLVPFVVLLTFLIAGYSPDWCAAMSIASIVLINWTRVALAWYRPQRFPMPDQVLNLAGIRDALIAGTENSLIVGSAAAAVGIIVGVVALTGLGLKMSFLIVSLAGGNLFIAVVLVGLASLLLGMALPITASYLVLVVLAGPALQQLGVALIAAHMIVFWLSQDSNITPPVCLGAYVAASIAGADPWKTGWTSFRFAKMLYILPLLFAFTPILVTGSVQAAAWVMLTALFGMIAFAGWSMAWLHRRTNPLEWLLLGVVALLCFLPPNIVLPGGVTGWELNIVGILGLLSIFQWQRLRPHIGAQVGAV